MNFNNYAGGSAFYRYFMSISKLLTIISTIYIIFYDYCYNYCSKQWILNELNPINLVVKSNKFIWLYKLYNYH